MIPIARHSVLRAARSQFYPTRTLRQPASSALARLLSTLAVLEQRDGKLQSSSFSAIAAAQKLGGSVTGFLAGAGVKGTSAAEAAKIKGLEKVVAVENEAYEKVCTMNCGPESLLICVFVIRRASPRTMPLCSSRTSRRASIHTLSPATRPSVRACCPAWPLFWICNRSPTSLESKARTVRTPGLTGLTCDRAGS